MTSGGTKEEGGTEGKGSWLAFGAMVAAVIAVAVLALWATGYWDKDPASSAGSAQSSSPRPSASKSPAAAKATPSPSAKTAKPSPKPLPTRSVPPQKSAYIPPPAPPPAAQPEPEPWPPAKECPVGQITARLTSVDFTESLPGYGMGYVTVTGRGVLTNGTNVPVTFPEYDIPNFYGLDERGQSSVIELYGTFDRVPPPGQPSTGYIVLGPGESVGYTATAENEFLETLTEVKYWHSSNGLASTLISFPDEYILDCSVPYETPDASMSIPNTFTG
ncbi:hypothetical protein [Arthrobacter caoxuetaonis]|uniref:Uncharacterized protein n=1 Tax=Arthrobacter caoxuetaonis TaxID=2886935 RepID=A0A9X1MGI2_9MICC|nr:hypothetical protein [Arthrobacter caoxuetaonis]MCC3299406.1 hypothetical protein [Arthrobacter caoxuetaonis]USQ59101.1 hypothetical protein NF551_18520 [Arthrobacter caoxuetaonis]